MIDWPAALSVDARIDFWTILVAITCNTACAILGCFLVLRRMSLLGDAISHAVLPGMAVAYFLTGTLSIVPMFIGGLVAGLLTTFLTHTLHEYGNVPEDSSMGVVYTSMFAAGVIMVSQVSKVHLDTDCVLFGFIETAFVDTAEISGIKFPSVLESLFPMLLLTIAFVTCFWKELKFSSFDPALASAMGISAALMHYLLMGMVAAVTVASLEAVGAILVIAMLIVPAATAHLLTERMSWMVLWAVVVGIISAVVGCLWARMTETRTAGMMAVVAGIQFSLAVCFAPRHGLVSKVWQNFRISLRIVAEDVIALLYRIEEQPGAAGYPVKSTKANCIRFTGGGLLPRLAIPALKKKLHVEETEDHTLKLTDKGRHLGQSLVRSHRLWEAFLDEHFDLPSDHLHEPASRIEHYIGPELQKKLEAELESPDKDPHGREIPPAKE